MGPMGAMGPNGAHGAHGAQGAHWAHGAQGAHGAQWAHGPRLRNGPGINPLQRDKRETPIYLERERERETASISIPKKFFNVNDMYTHIYIYMSLRVSDHKKIIPIPYEHSSFVFTNWSAALSAMRSFSNFEFPSVRPSLIAVIEGWFCWALQEQETE